MRRACLLILAASVFVLALALAAPLSPAAHAAPATAPASRVRHSSTHVTPSGARPYGGGGTSAACTQWHITPSPAPGGTYSQLVTVSADAANDVWAVGSASSPDGSVINTLIEHYNGTAWSIVSSPNVSGSVEDDLYGVVALAPNNVWAVGQAFPATGSGLSLIEHYDGSSWSIVSNPNTGISDEFYAVGADAANDVWAVGIVYTNNGNTVGPFTEHYDGSSWSIVSAPAAGSGALFSLSGVSVVGGQAFAAGSYGDSANNYHTLVEHYASGAWSVMATPDVGTTGSPLDAVAALSPTNVWAAGYTYDTSGNSSGGVFEHYDGTSWSVVANGSGTLNDSIAGLATVPGTTNLWAVGVYNFPPTPYAFAEQWQGYGWNEATIAPQTNASASILAVSAVSATNAWAVGISSGQALIEHYGGPPSYIFCR